MRNSTTRYRAEARKEWRAPEMRRLLASEAESGVVGNPDAEGTS